MEINGIDNRAKSDLCKRNIRIQNRSAHTLSRTMSDDRVTGVIRGNTRPASLAKRTPFPTDLSDEPMSALVSLLRQAKANGATGDREWQAFGQTLANEIASRLSTR